MCIRDRDGVLYSNILLKLYLKSLKHGGRLQLDEDIPYTAQMIATITRQQIGTVERALQIDVYKRQVYHRAYYSLDAYSWLENYALEHSRSSEDILLEREEMTTRLHLIAALPAALAHATPTQARRVHACYIAGIKQPEISRREGIHSSKVSVAIRRGLRNMRRFYDDLFQTE